jgi:hypothetical protein
MDYHKPDILNIVTGNVANDFKQFKEEVLIYIEDTETDKKSNKVQVARLKNLLGSEALKLYKTLKVSEDEAETVSSILKVLEDYCVPKSNKTMAIHMFLSRKQQDGESFDSFFIDLKSLIRPCEFGDQEDKLLRSQIIMGIATKSIKERLLREDVSLEKVVKYCRSVEAAENNIKIMMKNQPKEMMQSTQIENISKQQMQHTQTYKKVDQENCSTSSSVKPMRNVQVSANCSRCGYCHYKKPCPAYNKICSKCNKPNHFARVCRSNVSSGHELELGTTQQSELEQSKWIINDEVGALVNVNSIKSTHWTVPLDINGTVIIFKIDTGAIPKSSPARRVPYKISERLKLKLESLESRKIIEKCDAGE